MNGWTMLAAAAAGLIFPYITLEMLSTAIKPVSSENTSARKKEKTRMIYILTGSVLVMLTILITTRLPETASLITMLIP